MAAPFHLWVSARVFACLNLVETHVCRTTTFCVRENIFEYLFQKYASKCDHAGTIIQTFIGGNFAAIATHFRRVLQVCVRIVIRIGVSNATDCHGHKQKNSFSIHSFFFFWCCLGFVFADKIYTNWLISGYTQRRIFPRKIKNRRSCARLILGSLSEPSLICECIHFLLLTLPTKSKYIYLIFFFAFSFLTLSNSAYIINFSLWV